MKALRTFKTSGSIYAATKRNIVEDPSSLTGLLLTDQPDTTDRKAVNQLRSFCTFFFLVGVNKMAVLFLSMC